MRHPRHHVLRPFLRPGSDTTSRSRAPRRLVAAILAALAGTAAGCTAGANPAASVPRSPPSTSSSTVTRIDTRVPQPVGGRDGAPVTIAGTVTWDPPGYPGCVLLYTAGNPVLALEGSPVDQAQRAASTGRIPATQQVRITGFAPAGVIIPCGAALPFRVQQVTTMTP